MQFIQSKFSLISESTILQNFHVQFIIMNFGTLSLPNILNCYHDLVMCNITNINFVDYLPLGDVIIT